MSCQIPVRDVATRQNMDDSPHLVLQRWEAIPSSFFIVIKCVLKVVGGMEMFHVRYQLDVWQRDRKQVILLILSCKDWWQLRVNDRHEICL